MTFHPAIIRKTFNIIRPKGLELMDIFFQVLLTDYPALKPYFANVNIAQHKRIFLGGFTQIIDLLEDGEELAAFVEGLGEKHMRLNISPEHYEWFGDALIKAIGVCFGDKWTPELKSQWKFAYIIIANHLQHAIEQAKEEHFAA